MTARSGYKLKLVNVARRVFVIAATLVVVGAIHVSADGKLKAVIDDPDGFTNLRAEPDAKSAVVAKVKRGEVFTFELPAGDSEWYRVTLASGKKGYLHGSRVRLHATMADLADPKLDDDIIESARRESHDYFVLARAAARGEPEAMRTYFAFRGDGERGEQHADVMATVIHILGDEKLAAFLRQQPADYRDQAREEMQTVSDMGMLLEPVAGMSYLRRHFPKTSAALKLR
ncbi:MAG TPA: SH3 domain-containing protein [Chthoniobacterales bacterium]